MLDGMVIVQGPFRLDAQHRIEVTSDRMVQVLLLLRCDTEALVIDGEIGGQEVIGFVYRADTPQPHLLDQAILKCFEEALNPSFGLRRVGMELSDSEFLQGPAELAHRFCLPEVVSTYPRLVGRVFVQVNAHGNAILRDIPLEAVHRRDRPFILVEPGVHDACGIINGGHKDTLRSSTFKPIMVGTIHLEHLSVVVLSLAPLPVSFMLTVFLPLSCFQKRNPYRLPAGSDVFTLF